MNIQSIKRIGAGCALAAAIAGLPNLQAAEKAGLIVLKEDSKSGTYVVTGFGKSS